MIAMKVIPDPTNPNLNILELKIKAPASPKPIPIPVEQIPTLIYIDDNIEEGQLPTITHALTDTVNRMTWPNQVKIAISRHKLPRHLEKNLIEPDELITLASSIRKSTLIWLTNKETKELRKEKADSFKLLSNFHAIQPTTAIELIDELSDHIGPLKLKTLVNFKVQFEVPQGEISIAPIDYVPMFSKAKARFSASFIDLASEQVVSFKFQIGLLGKSRTHQNLKVTYQYEDLQLVRRVFGGCEIQVVSS